MEGADDASLLESTYQPPAPPNVASPMSPTANARRVMVLLSRRGASGLAASDGSAGDWDCWYAVASSFCCATTGAGLGSGGTGDTGVGPGAYVGLTGAGAAFADASDGGTTGCGATGGGILR